MMAPSAFKATEVLRNLDEGAREDRINVLSPAAPFNGSTAGVSGTLPARLKLQYNAPGGRTFVNFGQSSVRVKVAFYADAALTTGINSGVAAEDLALARYGAANMFSRAEFRISNVGVEQVEDHQQATSILYNTTKSTDWLDTVGALYDAQHADSERSVADATGTAHLVRDLWFKPALGIFHTDKDIRCGNVTYELDLTVDPQWDQKLVVSARTPRGVSVPGTNYWVKVLSAEWHVNELEPKVDIPLAVQDVIDVSRLSVFRQPLNASTSSAHQFVIPPAAFKSFVCFQQAAAGTSTYAAGEFTNEDVRDIRIRWGGRSIPDVSYNMEWGAVTPKRPYFDFLRALDLLEPKPRAAGAAMDIQEWKNTSCLFATALVAGEGSKSTSMRLELEFNTPSVPTAGVFLAIASPLRVFLSYDESGKLTSGEPAHSDEDTVAAQM